jgi:molybdopterin molybdotransferase
MLSVNAAEALILTLTTPLDAQTDQEIIPLGEALGRILAQPVVSELDFPHWDNSAMDGYAVRYEDVKASPAMLQVIEEIPAGKLPVQTVKAGQAARIFTGAMLPDGADTIVIQENTDREGDWVTVKSAPEPQAFVRQRGSFYRAGDRLLTAGIAVKGPELAVLAAAQCTKLAVYRRPRVAILSTGDELVAPDHPLGPGQIVDSNQYALAALVAQTGAIPLTLGIVPDDPKALSTAIAEALNQADLVISSGGVSVGDYDYVDQILKDLGATLHIRAVAVKPGKPLTVATFLTRTQRSQLYFGLPGNPVSSLVSFWRFVQPALRKLSGLSDGWGPTFAIATPVTDLKAGGQRETYLWGRLVNTETGYQFHPATGSHSSGNLINLTQTNGLAVVPVGHQRIPAGEAVKVLVLE